MFKKQYICHVLLLYIFSFGLSYADLKENDYGKEIVQKYIDNNLDADVWKGKQISIGEGTPFYMEKDIPSYMEYTITCDNNPKCGFVLVNIDGDGVSIPVASKGSDSPSQTLVQKSKEKKTNLDFYYFGPFDIYAKNKITGEISAVSPQIDPTEDLFEAKNQEDNQELQTALQDQKKNISTLFYQHLEEIIQYKKSPSFQKYQDEMEKYSNAPLSNNWVKVPGNETSNCNSYVPCYNQFMYRSGSIFCMTGCSPVAVAIIFGYHDRNTKPNLIPEFASLNSNTIVPHNIRHLIPEIRFYMGTYCHSKTGFGVHGGYTEGKNIRHSRYYVAYQGYNVDSEYITNEDLNTYFQTIKSNVNQGMPLVMDIQNFEKAHTIVVYGYQSSQHLVIVNAGWGPGWSANYEMDLFDFTLSGMDAIQGMTTMLIQ